MTYRTELPAHALAEIKKDKKQRKYWEAWQAVGDAKLDEADASQQVIDVELDWFACCVKHDVKPPLCGCGEHPARYVAARDARDEARVRVSSATKAFKAA
jgi:hypothetical protein